MGDDKITKITSGIGKELSDFATGIHSHAKEVTATAIDQFKKNEQARIVGRIEELFKHIRSLNANIEKTQNEIKVFERRIQEFYDGETTMDAAGTIHWKDGFYI